MDKREYDFDRLTVPEPVPVTDPDRHGKRWIGLMLLFTALIAGLVLTHTQRIPGQLTAETWPEAGPSSVFGVSQCPELESCPTCECAVHKTIPSDEFVERALASARKQGATDTDIAWMRDRWKKESWNNPVAIGQDGDIGLCQIHWASHKDVDPVKLMSNPEYAGEVCFGIVRDNRVCGEWQHCCYRRGICGCQLWLKKEKGVIVNWRNDADCRRK